MGSLLSRLAEGNELRNGNVEFVAVLQVAGNGYFAADPRRRVLRPPRINSLARAYSARRASTGSTAEERREGK